MKSESKTVTVVAIENLHQSHPRLRATDWCSPLVHRLLGSTEYSDGNKQLSDSYRSQNGLVSEQSLTLTWKGLESDYKLCINTYQSPVLTEFASLAIACILVKVRANLEITEVTRRGEKVDFWLGDRELLLEVSGREVIDLEVLCDQKASEQLLVNPYEKDGYVCVAEYQTPSARLWFYAFGKNSK